MDWEARYKAQNTPWDRGDTSPALQAWLDGGELAPSRVLVPGCGSGYEVLELARRGFQVTAVDIAPAPLERLGTALEEESLTAELICADLLDWMPDQPVDLIYEQTCLCALDPIHRETYETKLRDWLKPAGQLLALFMQTQREGGPPFHCSMNEMQQLFSASHWQWPGTEPLFVEHHSGLHELGYALRRV